MLNIISGMVSSMSLLGQSADTQLEFCCQCRKLGTTVS